MPAITSANVAQAIVKLVAAEALPALVGNLIMGNLVNRNYEPVLGQAGDTVNVPISPALVANNIAEGGTVQAQNPNLGNAQIVLNTHVEATFLVPDVTKVLAVPDLLMTYMHPAVIAIAENIERSLLNLYAGFTTNTPLGTAGTALTKRRSTRRKRFCSRPRCHRTRTSTWWSTRTATRRCGRLRGSASGTRRDKRALQR
jgi:hypothetical protein